MHTRETGVPYRVVGDIYHPPERSSWQTWARGVMQASCARVNRRNSTLLFSFHGPEIPRGGVRELERDAGGASYVSHAVAGAHPRFSYFMREKSPHLGVSDIPLSYSLLNDFSDFHVSWSLESIFGSSILSRFFITVICFVRFIVLFLFYNILFLEYRRKT